jgi:hypothetical protein
MDFPNVIPARQQVRRNQFRMVRVMAGKRHARLVPARAGPRRQPTFCIVCLRGCCHFVTWLA